MRQFQRLWWMRGMRLLGLIVGINPKHKLRISDFGFLISDIPPLPYTGMSGAGCIFIDKLVECSA